MVSESLCKSSGPILEIRNLTKRFGGLVAVDSVSFDVSKGMILGIIGPNGAGKTTLFNVINGFIKPDTGKIIFDGEDITGVTPYNICAKGLSRTFQLVRPFRNVSVLDNVIIGAFNRTNSREEASRKALEMLELVGLTRVKNELTKNLTIVDQKRVELAKALATNPKLLLLDELIAGLNPAEIYETTELIKKVRDSGITIIIIEHVIKAVIALSDRVIVLHHGKKIAEDSPTAVAKDTKVIEAYLGSEII